MSDAPLPKDERRYLLDRLAAVKWLLRVFLVISLALIGLDLVVERHVDHPFERVAGFYGIWGFVSCVVLVLAARVLRRLVKRGEDYYGD